MKVKELREILANATDDMEVVVADVNGSCINLTHADSCGNLIYLNSVEEFIEDWYDAQGLEKNYDYSKD